LSWRLSITMEAAFCVETLEDALARHGKPDIFNTDQGSQFTGAAFTGVLVGNGIAISMDGKGAWRDNVFVERLWRSVKYEEVVCCERHCSKKNMNGGDALSEMRVGPSKSACRSRLQTATSCIGQEPLW
jgi:transposase InsO family protein